MKKPFLILCFCMLLQGCVTRGAEKVSALESNHRTVVMSLVGDSLVVRTLDIRFFKNDEEHFFTMQDWGLDSYLEELAVTAINGGGRVQALAAGAEARERFGAARYDFWEGEVVVDAGFPALANYAKAQGADSLLLIAPAGGSGDVFLGGGGFIFHKRYGVYQDISLFISRVQHYATLALILIDAETGAQIARTTQQASVNPGKSYWIEEHQDPNQEGIRGPLKRSIWSLHQKALGTALSELRLTGAAS